MVRPEGLLNVTGDADWHNMAEWRVNSRVFADSLLVDMPPIVKMNVIPDLTLTMQPDVAQVTGSIHLLGDGLRSKSYLRAPSKCLKIKSY
ncbi:hypothetical protein ACT691_08015 [Vibrio metschnikovii]